MGTAACARARPRTASSRRRIEGRSTSARASESINAQARLLMSSDVHAKWMNALARLSPGATAICSRMKYSTALTSWLVSRSMAFTRRASSSEKPLAMSSRRFSAPGSKGASASNSASAASALSHRTSTAIRYRIRPNSLVIGRNAAVREPYRPSAGEIAVSVDRSISDCHQARTYVRNRPDGTLRRLKSCRNRAA